MNYGTIVVCGGGCYGGYYVRQLARARAAGAMRFDRLVVVDRDPACPVAQLASAIRCDDGLQIATHGWQRRRADDAAITPHAADAYRHLPLEMRLSEWAPFFDEWLGQAVLEPAAVVHDAVVPSPLMPHLLADWVAGRLRTHRPGDQVTRVALTTTPSTPWQRTAPDGAHYASFATWMCPINCIEPPRCPETRGTRDWTMPETARRAADDAAGRGAPYDVVATFHTSHRQYGVGMFDVADAVRADLALQHAASPAPASISVLVASVSHCHGALAALHSAAPA